MTKNGEPSKVALIFLFAIETGMRAGEICKLSWENVDIENRVALLLETKNGTNRERCLSLEKRLRFYARSLAFTSFVLILPPDGLMGVLGSIEIKPPFKAPPLSRHPPRP